MIYTWWSLNGTSRKDGKLKRKEGIQHIQKSEGVTEILTEIKVGKSLIQQGTGRWRKRMQKRKRETRLAEDFWLRLLLSLCPTAFRISRSHNKEHRRAAQQWKWKDGFATLSDTNWHMGDLADDYLWKSSNLSILTESKRSIHIMDVFKSVSWPRMKRADVITKALQVVNRELHHLVCFQWWLFWSFLNWGSQDSLSSYLSSFFKRSLMPGTSAMRQCSFTGAGGVPFPDGISSIEIKGKMQFS